MTFPILTYHSVLPQEKIAQLRSRERKIYILQDLMFEEQMRYLNENGYSTLSFSEIRTCIHSPGPLPDKSICLTFDDGRKDSYEIVLPILKKYGLKATFFIISDFVGKEGFLTWEQIMKLSLAGMEIQSHSHRHINLRELSAAEGLSEMKLSKTILESHVKKKIDVFALPFGQGDFNIIKKSAQSAGYSFVCTTIPGANHLSQELYFLKRYAIKFDYELSRFKACVEMKRMPVFFYRVRKVPIEFLKLVLTKKHFSKLRGYFLKRPGFEEV
jgi:peptidoglycan/xylan/chitin deacetylase (PgdA/CDA1 family)